jgi:hypothetical protein
MAVAPREAWYNCTIFGILTLVHWTERRTSESFGRAEEMDSKIDEACSDLARSREKSTEADPKACFGHGVRFPDLIFFNPFLLSKNEKYF